MIIITDCDKVAPPASSESFDDEARHASPLSPSSTTGVTLFRGRYDLIDLDEPTTNRVQSQSYEPPPLYQKIYSSSEYNKDGQAPISAQQTGVTLANFPALHTFREPLPSLDPSSPLAMSAAVEAEWYETLKELHNNLADLENARNRLAKAQTTPEYLRPRNALEDGAREVRVLEELSLAGMRRLSYVHPDPAVQAEWRRRADEFSRALRSKDDGNPMQNYVVNDAGSPSSGSRFGRNKVARMFIPSERDSASVIAAKGAAIVFLGPPAACCGILYDTGAMIYESGKFVAGLGRTKPPVG